MKTRCAKIVLVGSICALVGCAMFDTRTTRRASVVEFLYPNKERPIEKPTVPVLSLPLDVGIVFVPENSPIGDAVLSEKAKIALLERVAAEFKKYPFIRNVEPIPTLYLRRGGSFDNLDQIGTMFGVDAVALVSYDQVQFTDTHQLGALSYWTIVGAYTVPAERNTTHTMVDAAVYHIASHKLLFRAPGISRVQRQAAPVDLASARRQDSATGFACASDDLTTNLVAQLDVFREKVRKSPDGYKVEAKQGYDLKAVGQVDGVTLFFILSIAGGIWLCAKSKNSRG